MPMTSQMLEIVNDWHRWNGANHRARELDAMGDHASADNYRALRDQYVVNPVEVPRTTDELIRFLTGSHWDVITEARFRGASWSQIGAALNERPETVKDRYASIVEWCCERRSDSIDFIDSETSSQRNIS